ncbi:MAG: RNA 3'-terminal phosphate cyclase [Candidatus Anstonellales archaeon]
MLFIDGSAMEGGGQILRLCLSLSSITKKPFRLENIRANRPNPGLAPQHLAAVSAARKVSRAEVKGAEPGSSTLEFIPKKIVGGKYKINIGTAGSAVLVAQTLIPILIYAEKPSEVEIIGGTHVKWAPTYEYFSEVFLPSLSFFGISCSSSLLKPGYYPEGGGIMRFLVKPAQPKGNSFWPKSKTKAIIRVDNLDFSIALREKKVLVEKGIEGIRIIQTKESIGNSLLIWSGSTGVCSVGEKGKRAEELAEEAFESFSKENQYEVDTYLADQLLPYASLSKGATSYSVSEHSSHLLTSARIIKEFVSRDIRIGGKKVEIC